MSPRWEPCPGGGREIAYRASTDKVKCPVCGRWVGNATNFREGTSWIVGHDRPVG